MAKSPEIEHPQKAFGWAARDSSGILSPFHFSRRENRDKDVTVKVLYCGICHSDLHHARNEWGFANYPMVPGHEMIEIVASIGKGVKKFRVGERVGVGVMVGSCKTCGLSEEHSENYCPDVVFNYNSINFDGTKSYGGYSDIIVVDEHFVLRIPDNLPSDAAAPLLCAGAAIYSPMKYYGMTEPGKHSGIAELGGLGHVAVKIAKAFGLNVTAISNNSAQILTPPAQLTEECPLELSNLSSNSTMMMKGTISNRMVVVLIDSGASHNFIAEDLISELGIPIAPTRQFEVRIGNGGCIRGSGLCEGVVLELQGNNFTQNFYPIKLGCAEVVLGVSWLKTLGDISSNYNSLIMQFVLNGTNITLRGDPSLTFVSLKTMLRGVQSADNGFLLEFQEMVAAQDDLKEDLPREVKQVVENMFIRPHLVVCA